MDIAPLIGRVARGKHGSQHLSQIAAESVFASLLGADADPLQLGAFLIAQRMKGESSAELAGFVGAARLRIAGFDSVEAPPCAVDLPCYAGKRRAGHASLVAALAARDAGIPVFVHGVSEIAGRVTAWQVLEEAGVKRAENLPDAAAILAAEGMVYADLAELCPDLFRIYGLRPRLGVRSFGNTVARLLNPLACAGQINGFFHTPYGALMGGANALLGQPRSLLLMGAEGEPELYADRQKLMMCQQGECITRLSYADAGCAPYPKAARPLSMIADESAAMVGGETAARAQAVIARMRQAFAWASGQDLPDDWHQED